jgi:PAS domain S-box-containing protein
MFPKGGALQLNKSDWEESTPKIYTAKATTLMSEWRKGINDAATASPEPLEILEFRRLVRDLIALSALPALWKNYEPSRIADGAASALASMIGANFVYVGLPDERPPIEIVMTPTPVDPARRDSIAAAVKREIGRAGSRQAIPIANPSLGEPLRLAIAPIGLEGAGVIAAGAEAGGFPTETQRLLIGMVASEATLALHRWHGETEMRRFVALVESSAGFVGYADLDGTARYLNPAGMRLVGLGEHERVPPLHILEFLAPEDRARARDEAWPIVRQSGRWVGELTFRHFASGAEIPFLLDWFRIDDSRTGDAINIAAVGKDLRAQKSAELELRHLNETLEAQVAQRTAELAEANQKILTEMREHERLESRLRVANLELGHAARLSTAGQMAAAIAHELNQPLTVIVNSLGAAKRLLQHETFIGIGPAKEVMDEAVQQSLRAGQVVGRLRNFLIRGDTETRVEDVATMVDEATTLALIGPSASEVKMRVRLDPEAPHVVGNRIDIQQVLINLMRNSLEAMVGADRRELDLTTTLRRPDLVEFAVADSGPGIDPDVADRIFEPFVTTKRNGMGMGLSICRSIIESHGGRLEFEPNPEGGALFRFTLPAVLPERDLDAS